MDESRSSRPAGAAGDASLASGNHASDASPASLAAGNSSHAGDASPTSHAGNSSPAGDTSPTSHAGNSSPAGDALLIAATKLVVSLAVLAAGFSAVSDDDYARVVIAERFAHAPSLDPSGTSWLPFPFWIYGSALAVFGRTLLVARVTALLLAVLAGVAVWVAARWLGASRWAAVAAGVLAALIPHAAWLGVATVPEAPTAALILLGACSLASRQPRVRLLGAVSIAVATLCRYEAWPVALGIALVNLYDVFLRRTASVEPSSAAADGRTSEDRAIAPALGVRLGLACAATALAPPLLWMLHGQLAHGDPLFFVARVSAYQHALGTPLDPLAVRLLRLPTAIVRFEPEIALLALAIVLALLVAKRAALLAAYARPALVLALLVALLVASDVRASGATHHAERNLLAVWLLAAIVIADAVTRAAPHVPRRNRWILAAILLPGAVALGALIRNETPDEALSHRGAEIQIGRAARQRMKPDQRLLIDTDDYGFFAIIAAFGAPERTLTVDDHDPRHRRPSDPLASPEALRTFLQQNPAAWLVAPTARARTALPDRTPTTRHGDFALIDLSALAAKPPVPRPNP